MSLLRMESTAFIAEPRKLVIKMVCLVSILVVLAISSLITNNSVLK